MLSTHICRLLTALPVDLIGLLVDLVQQTWNQGMIEAQDECSVIAKKIAHVTSASVLKMHRDATPSSEPAS